MKIYNNLEVLQKLPGAVVTSGTFDGVHLGHQKILDRLKEISKQQGGESVVVTYWPHPRMVVSDMHDELLLLSTIEEKIALLEALGIDNLVIVPFTRSFSELSSLAFIQQILVEKIGTKKLVIGYDHRFGRNREGSFDFLKQNCSKFGFEVEEIPRQDIEDMAISSSRIRKALLTGQVGDAMELLGRAYSLTGTVVKGKQLGRNLGFPTANIQILETHKLIPANGVYVIRAIHRGTTYHGMLNIGTRPTVDGHQRTIEAHLFDFNTDIYGEELTVALLTYIRQEQKFDSLERLVEQINRDEVQAKKFLNLN
ncbi:riboflavin kinase/FMN adenylyltransferase [Dyadobacter jejuensis]|uniref:Riboflavin biosynthesis protein n=1 Tax=Dyadobacter jejuensis TaxID=1082580 RepID=A0A316AGK1_9BACT|nr:bifunctional riboflavin kinase/FAD synthetase [Dyadobacter jejuensis]PWJ56722.1 riboflavin kinase/FMN adenylyltransferase [Dyadobacter jejuensis]